ncbi:MAG: class I SAM-dependent methyltransferase [Chloroflexi bacterium]|nr:class I SAM-dependent methyltransferase [Chloroflexota bacterium]
MLAELYHAHHRLYREDIPFWQGLAAQQGGPILELGCGTGRVTLELAGEGHEVYGLDNDADTLAVLQRRLSESDLPNVAYRQADMTEFSLKSKFPLIILPCNTYSTLSAQQRLVTLECVQKHLAAGGLFAASMLNPARVLELPESGEPELEETIVHPRSGQPVQVSSAWQRGESSFQVIWHYDHMLPDGKVERTTVTANHELASTEDYQHELQQAGFELKDVYGDFEEGSYHADSPYFIFVAAPQS